MLDPNVNRLDYGDLLNPPEGYKLDFAVGCTYSLELDALIGAAMALGLSEESDSEIIQNPLCVLNALRRTGDKLLLFCQAGQIHLPKKQNRLHMLLEDMVAEVMLKKKGRYPSFHPKIWLIRYMSEEGKAHYRFIVLSRNLTFDQSWDVALCLDGEVGKETNKNTPLSDFIEYLDYFVPRDEKRREKRNKLKKLAKELRWVNFKSDMKFEFAPTGIAGHEAQKRVLAGEGYDEITVVSPFLSKGMMNSIASKLKAGKQLCLLTREKSLGTLGDELFNAVKAHILRDILFSGENGEESVQRELHAKMYLSKKGDTRELYVGSLNASENAFLYNVEFGVKLSGSNLAKENVFNGVLYGENLPAEEVRFLKEHEKDKEERLDLDIRRVVRAEPYAFVTENSSFYDVRIKFNEAAFEHEVLICPLFMNCYKKVETEVVFENMELTRLSTFYKVKVRGNTELEKIIIIPTEGIPEDRDKAVLSMEIDKNSDNFFRYIMYLLGDDMAAADAELMQSEAYGETGKGVNTSYILPSLYERMLKITAKEPQRLKEVEFLLDAIKDDGVVPEEFKSLYEIFEEAVRENGKRRKRRI